MAIVVGSLGPMVRSNSKFLVLVFIALILAGCATPTGTPRIEKIKRPPLRVGVTPEFPPVIFLNGGRIDGVEADLARLLGKRLARPVRFIRLDWTDQIRELLAGKTDIIMSGMTVTRARQFRINFTDPYFKSGLLAMMRSQDAPKYKSRESVTQSFAKIGVVEGTTGDVFVQKNFPNSRKIALSKARHSPSELRRRSIDIFVYDAPAIMWLVSENEADLVATKKLLNTEYFAWGVRRKDQEFLAQVNGILGEWKKDGTLKRIVKRWIPYMEQLEQP